MKGILRFKDELNQRFAEGMTDEQIEEWVDAYTASEIDLIAVLRTYAPPPPRKIAKDAKEAAELIDKAADDWSESGVKHFSNDPRMIKAYKQDTKDMKAVAKLLRSGKTTEAYQAATYLDTILRDHIPDAAWDFLEKYA